MIVLELPSGNLVETLAPCGLIPNSPPELLTVIILKNTGSAKLSMKKRFDNISCYETLRKLARKLFYSLLVYKCLSVCGVSFFKKICMQ